MSENKASARTASSEKSSRSQSLFCSSNPFHCSAEWHFAQMTSRLAAPLYSWGRRLSWNSDSFFPSAISIGSYFDRNRTTVMSALQELVINGWAEVVQKEPGKPVMYRFIDHEEWARTHPDSCTQKDVMPWEGEGDPLGRLLYAASGGQAKFLPGQMNGLRKSKLSDQEIAAEFRAFLDRHPQSGPQWGRVYFDFRLHLLRVAADASKAAEATSTPNGVSNRSDPPCRLHQTPPVSCVRHLPVSHSRHK